MSHEAQKYLPIERREVSFSWRSTVVEGWQRNQIDETKPGKAGLPRVCSTNVYWTWALSSHKYLPGTVNNWRPVSMSSWSRRFKRQLGIKWQRFRASSIQLGWNISSVTTSGDAGYASAVPSSVLTVEECGVFPLALVVIEQITGSECSYARFV